MRKISGACFFPFVWFWVFGVGEAVGQERHPCDVTTWTFQEFSHCTSFGILELPGGAIGERFYGQRVSGADGDNEEISGSPTYPLTLYDAGLSDGVVVVGSGGSLAIAGLSGRAGSCTGSSIGKGALSILFQEPVTFMTAAAACSGWFANTNVTFYSDGGSVIEELDFCNEDLAFQIDGLEPTIRGVTVQNTDDDGVTFDDITFLPRPVLSDAALDPYDGAVPNFTDFFPDPALDYLRSDFVTQSYKGGPSAAGTLISAAYFSPSLGVYAYLYQVRAISGGRIADICLPFQSAFCIEELTSFHLEDDPNGSVCGLGGPGTPLGDVFEEYSSEEGGICVSRAARPTAFGGFPASRLEAVSYITRFRDLGAGEQPLSEVFGVVSTTRPARELAVAAGKKSVARPLAVAPSRPASIFVILWQGNFAPERSGMDILSSTFVYDQTLMKKVHARVWNPGFPDSPDRRGLRFLIWQAVNPSDRVTALGHSHGGHRTYLLAVEDQLFLEAAASGLDGIMPIDPIDWDRCEDIFNCSDSNQSDLLKPAPPGVPFLDYVQRSDYFTALMGYNIGEYADECSYGELTTLSNHSCVIPDEFHTTIDNSPEVHSYIRTILRNL